MFHKKYLLLILYNINIHNDLNISIFYYLFITQDRSSSLFIYYAKGVDIDNILSLIYIIPKINKAHCLFVI